MNIRDIVLDNWGIKLVSLLLAVSLWLFVTSKGKMEIPLTVPVELQNIPAGMAVVGDVAQYLDVRIQGQERLLRDINVGRKVVCVIDLRTTRPGENTLRISPDDIQRPSGISVTHLSPYEVRIRLEPLLKKTVRLRPVLHGTPLPGYRVVGIAATPARVTAEGPAGVIRPLAELQTMPIDLQGAKGSMTVDPRIDTEGKPIKLLDKNVSIQITIKKVSR